MGIKSSAIKLNELQEVYNTHVKTPARDITDFVQINKTYPVVVDGVNETICTSNQNGTMIFFYAPSSLKKIFDDVLFENGGDYEALNEEIKNEQIKVKFKTIPLKGGHTYITTEIA